MPNPKITDPNASAKALHLHTVSVGWEHNLHSQHLSSE